MHLHWQTHGGNGPYLLLVHGMLCSRAQWLWNLPALKRVCRPVTVELWGHGRSPSPETVGHYAPKHYITEFEAIREQLGDLFDRFQWDVADAEASASAGMGEGG